MCLILFAWQTHPDFPLIVAANRDEFYARPTESAHVWPDSDPPILAGRDLQAGGTWMGVSPGGRFAAVTNYREVPAVESDRSRGQLVTDFLSGNQSAAEYAQQIAGSGQHYAGFNLLVSDAQHLLHVSNRNDNITPIKSGVHGLSNASLNTPWPKVATGRARLEKLANAQSEHADLQHILTDDTIASDGQLPDTGVPKQLEQALSAAKIVLPEYGTRCSTTLFIDASGNIDFMEQRFKAGGQPDGCSHIRVPG